MEFPEGWRVSEGVRGVNTNSSPSSQSDRQHDVEAAKKEKYKNEAARRFVESHRRFLFNAAVGIAMGMAALFVEGDVKFAFAGASLVAALNALGSISEREMCRSIIDVSVKKSDISAISIFLLSRLNKSVLNGFYSGMGGAIALWGYLNGSSELMALGAGTLVSPLFSGKSK